eukprot:TRINITY_DN2942_c0_g1_i2.p2 TRINITY_DN2942_c0_g1~~TRINITY_DN2942_c0_g1_i2.p2  ORF type:complete len:182 (-),score=19.64 TRINITY_DN2942_c0_g1_i2:53-574(-)
MDELAEYRKKMAEKFATEPAKEIPKDDSWPSGNKMKAKFGPVLLDPKGNKIDTAKALGGKIVGVYFSAHWCGPCRQFTPALASFYNSAVKSGKKFAIVFCSSDKDTASFKEYHGSMPWYALPFGDSKIRDLSTSYAVRGIPTLVILNKDGDEITRDGRSDVMSGGDAYARWAK